MARDLLAVSPPRDLLASKPPRDLLASAPASLQDVAGIRGPISEDLAPEDILGDKYWFGRAASEFIEKPVMATAQFAPQLGKYALEGQLPINPALDILQANAPIQRWVGKNVMPNLNKLIETLDPEKSGLITPHVSKARAVRREAAYKQSLGKGIFRDVGESVFDFTAFMASVWATKKLPAVRKFMGAGKGTKQIGLAKAIEKAGGKVPQQLLNSIRLRMAGRHAAVLGTHGFLTTPGTLEERRKSALYRIAYNITPVVTGYMKVAQLPGLAGVITPRVVDTMLNTFITMPTYKKAYDMAGGFNAEFASAAIPQFVMDVGMALTTAGFPEQARIRRWKGYHKTGRLKEMGIDFPEFKGAMDSFLRTVNKAEEVKDVKINEVGRKVTLSVLQDKQINDNLKRPAETRQIAKNITLRLKNGKGEINLGDPALPRQLKEELLRKIEQAEDRGADKDTFKQILQDDIESRQDSVEWTGGSLESRDAEGTVFFMNVGKRMSINQLAIEMHKEKMTPDQVKFRSSSERQTEKTFRETLDRAIRMQRVQVDKAETKPTVEQKDQKNLDDVTEEIVTRVPKEKPSLLSGTTKSGQRIYTKLTSKESKVVFNEVKNLPGAGTKDASRLDGRQIHVDVNTKNLTKGAKEVSKVEFAKHQPLAKETLEKAAALPEGVVPRREKMLKWDWNAYKSLRFGTNRLPNVPVVSTIKSLRKTFDGKRIYYGAAITENRNEVLINYKTLNKFFSMYEKGQRWYHNKDVIIPNGMTKEQFRNFVVEHEKIHLSTGLDGGAVDENMANTLALERIGRDDLAKQILDKVDTPKAVGSRQAKGATYNYETGKWEGVGISEGTTERDMTTFDSYKGLRNQTLSREQAAEITKSKADMQREAAEEAAMPTKELIDKPVEHPIEREDAFFKEDKQIVANKLDTIITDFLHNRGYSTERLGQIRSMEEVDTKQLIDDYVDIGRLTDSDKLELRAILDQSGFKIPARLLPADKIITQQELYQSGQDHNSMYSETQRSTEALSNNIHNNRRLNTYLKSIKDPKQRAEVERFIKENEQNKDLLMQHVSDQFNPYDYETNRKRIYKVTQEGKQKSIESRNIEDALGGDPVPNMSSPMMGPDGKDAQRYAKGIKFLVKAMNFFGINEDGFKGFVGSKNYQQWMQGIRDKAHTQPSFSRQSVINRLMTEKRASAYVGFMKGTTADTIIRSVWEHVESDPLKADTKQGRQDKMDVLLDLMNYTDQEIHTNAGGAAGTFSSSDLGNGKPWDTVEQRNSNIKQYQRLATALGRTVTSSELAGLQQARPKQMFWNLLPEPLKAMQIHMKRNCQNVMLDRMLKSGVLDDADMYDSVMNGYTRAVYRKKGPQAEAPRQGKNPNTLKSADYPQKRWKTHAEFVEAGEQGGWIPVSDYSVSMADYVGNSTHLLRMQDQLNFIKGVDENGNPTHPNPEDARFPIVGHIGDRYGGVELTNDLAQKLGYIEMNEAPGLRKKAKGGWRAPMVHKSIADTVRYIYSPKEIEQLRGVKQLNGLVKRMVMWSPRLYAMQIASSPWLWIGGKQAWKHGIKPLVTFDIERKGLVLGKDILKGQDSLYGHLKDEVYDPVLLEKFMQYGIRGFDYNYIMNMLFDSTKAEKHPLRRSMMENTAEFIKTQAGMNKYAFDRYVSKNVYLLAKAMTDRVRQANPQMDLDTAVRRVATMVGDFTGMLDSSIYGKERDVLQFGFFARDFTMSFMRQVTGAAGLHMDLKTEGPMRWMNPLFHGEISKADLKSIQPYYIRQLSQVIVSKLILINLIQMALGQGFAWDNEPKKKLMIKTPFMEGSGKPTYLDPLLFREASQLVDLIPRVGPWRNWSRGPGQLFRQKLSYGLNAMVDQLSNTDWRGKDITARSEAVPLANRLADRMRHQLWGVIPTAFRADVKKPGALPLGQGLGIPIKTGRALQPGFTAGQDQRIQDAIDKAGYTREQVLKQARRFKSVDQFITSPTGRKMISKGLVSAGQIRRWLRKEMMPQTSKIKANRRAILRSGVNIFAK